MLVVGSALVIGIGLGMLPLRIALGLGAGFLGLTVLLVFFAPSDMAAPFAYAAYLGFFMIPVLALGIWLGRWLRRRWRRQQGGPDRAGRG